MGNIYFALSDIHGADVSMKNFIESGFDIDNPSHKIVLMGDYWDRRKGYSYQIVQFIEYLQRELPHRSTILIGNHDEMLLEVLEKLYRVPIGDNITGMLLDLQLYFSNGGDVTIRELVGGVTPSATMTAAKHRRIGRLINLIKSFEKYLETQDYIFTHAFINKERRTDTWDRNMIYSEGFDNKCIVIGHTSFFHLGAEAIIHNWKWAESSRIHNNVILIDNGSGTNIVKFKEVIQNY